MRRLLMSRLIRIFTVFLVFYFYFQKMKNETKTGRCPNLPDVQKLPGFTYPTVQMKALSRTRVFSCRKHRHDPQIAKGSGQEIGND